LFPSHVSQRFLEVSQPGNSSGNIISWLSANQETVSYSRGQTWSNVSGKMFSILNTLVYIKHTFSSLLIHMYYSCSLGPTFGAGPDLSIAHDCNVNTDSGSRLSHSYGGEHGSPTSLMGAAKFKIADYEVFAPK
jgi:hypothetical protein